MLQLAASASALFTMVAKPVAATPTPTERLAGSTAAAGKSRDSSDTGSLSHPKERMPNAETKGKIALGLINRLPLRRLQKMGSQELKSGLTS